MYQRILLAVDGSDLASRAIPEVSEIAAPLGAEVVVLQAVSNHADQKTSADAAHSKERTSAEQTLSAAAEQLRTNGVGSVRTMVVAGSPGATIVEHADALHCDLVVMATHGRSGAREVLMGSVAEYVVRHCLVAPVLLVGPGRAGLLKEASAQRFADAD